MIENSMILKMFNKRNEPIKKVILKILFLRGIGVVKLRTKRR